MEDSLTYKIITCIIEVNNNLGPGLLESIYEKALLQELKIQGLKAENQIELKVDYKGTNLGTGYRLDILVENEVIVELKSVDELRPVHTKQLLTYLKLTHKRVGLLVNFNEANIIDGIKRVVNG